jgi:DNA-3-methyladenine glycosylase II
MPATRSSTRLAKLATTAATQATNGDASKRAPSRKRKPEPTLVKENTKKPFGREDDQVTLPTISQQLVQTVSASDTQDAKLVPAVLTFDYENAKKHLIEVDHRFEDLFRKMKCKPFEHLEQVHPFRYEQSSSST